MRRVATVGMSRGFDTRQGDRSYGVLGRNGATSIADIVRLSSRGGGLLSSLLSCLVKWADILVETLHPHRSAVSNIGETGKDSTIALEKILSGENDKHATTKVVLLEMVHILESNVFNP